MNSKEHIILSKLATIGIFVSIFQIIVFFFLIKTLFWTLSSLLVGVFFGLVLIFNNLKHFNISQYLYFAGSSLLITFFATNLPSGTGLRLYYPSLLAFLFLLLDFRKETLKFLILFISIVSLIFISYFFEGQFSIVLLDQKTIKFLYVCNYICSILIFVYILYNLNYLKFKTKDALFETNAKLKAIFDSSQQAIFLIDLDLKILKFNKTASQQIKIILNKDIQKGDYVNDYIPQDAIQQYIYHFNLCIETKSIVTYERHLVNENGEEYFYEIIFSPVYNENSQIIGVAAAGLDVSSKKKLEKDIQFRDILLTNIFEESPDALFLTDSISKEILACSKSTITMFEANSEDEIKNIEWMNLHNNPIEESSKMEVENALLDKGEWKSEIEYKTLKGKVFWGAIHIKRIKVLDKSYDLVRVVDITYKIIEKENLINLHLLEQKEIANKLKQKNLGLIIHGQEKERQRISKELHDGLSQMLTAARLNLEVIDTSHSLESHTQQQKVKDILHQLVIEVKRLSNNLMPTVIADFGLVYAIENLIKLIPKTIKVKFEYNNEIENVQLDTNIQISVYRIVQESLNNSIKYSNADLIHIFLGISENNELILEVKDDGLGFEIDKINNIDEPLPFNGLNNMKERAELINAHFEITSVPNKGTLICVVIPLF